MWDYICPKCRKEVKKNSHKCPFCNEWYGKPLRVPPRILKDPKALEDYVHKHVFPRVSKFQRGYLAQFFTEYLNSGWEDSGGTDPTDNGKWDGYWESPTVVGSPVFEGDYALEIDSNSEGVYKNFTEVTEAHGRFYFRFPTAPISGYRYEIASLTRAGWYNLSAAEVYNDGGTLKWRLTVYESGGEATYTAGSPNPVVDTWYCVEIDFDRNAANGAHLWVDGNLLLTCSGTTHYSECNRFRLRYHDNGYVEAAVYYDCAVLADTYIGPESTAQTYTKTWTTDTLFKKLGIPKTLSVDTAFQKQDIPITFKLNAAFQKSFTTQKQIDTLLQKPDILETFGIDVDFLKRDVIKSFAVDAHFSALATHTISRQMDVLFKKLDTSKTFGLDVYFGLVAAETRGKTFGLDVIFAYKVKLPELWLDEEGKVVLNLSKPYTWVGS